MDLLSLSADSFIITANRRQRAALIEEYNQLQISQKKKSWSPLPALPITTWIESLWQKYVASAWDELPSILSAHQELLLWEEIISQSKVGETLLQLSKTAEIARSAWITLKQWRIPLTHSELNQTEDSLAFKEWACAFVEKSRQLNLIDLASLTDFIIQKINEKIIQIPKKIILVGFADVTPQFQYLFDVCESLGCEVSLNQNKENISEIYQKSFSDEESELLTQARWAKQLLETEGHKKNLRIGCIIPNLEKKREQVIRIYSAVFGKFPEICLDYTQLPFNISAGKSLPEYPIIHTALQILQLNANKITADDFYTLLRSPFIGGAEAELIQRLNLQNYLHEKNKFSNIKKWLADDPQPNAECLILRKCINNYFEVINKIPKKAHPQQWVKTFYQILTALGWPGERSLNSHEYQTVKRFFSALNEFETYGLVLPNCSYAKALHFFKQLCVKTIFQPQSPEAPIQILGVLEAADLKFDSIWITGFTDLNFPALPQPNPFIPANFQKKHNMPHATAEKEFLYTEKLIKQFTQAAKKIIFSYANKIDETETRPSPFLKDTPQIDDDKIALDNFSDLAALIFDKRQNEPYEDFAAHPIPENISFRSGSYLFKLQASCPFRAFAELRLFATPPIEKILGLDPKDRGNIIHKTLELIWGQIQNSEQLKAYSKADLDALVATAIKKAFATIEKTNTQVNYLKLEKNRIQSLILRWLELEKLRPGFKVIGLEQEYKITIAGLNLTLRIDRIDETLGKNKLIIDYKTGKYNSIKDWFGERIVEPQLPLYAITQTDEKAAISFAELHPETLCFTGISDWPTEISTIKNLTEVKFASYKIWEEQHADWHRSLEKIAMDFKKGQAQVDPKEKTICNYCHLANLCRIHELNGTSKNE